jgi:lipid II:glycine glycyltransferase (peptidoglycan interpeptide bridge formation enzyme)
MDFLSAQAWDQFINEHPEAHILQTSPWGALKSDFGWTPRFFREGNLGAMVLFRHLPFGLSIAYIPRGPVGEGDWGKLWIGLDEYCQKENAVFLRVEPNLWEPIDKALINRQLPGFVRTEQTIQPPRTIMIDIDTSEEALLMGMKSKTRYNIRLAERKDVVVSPSDDVESFHKMMLTTGSRDEFGIHSRDYYQRAYEIFSKNDACVLLIARFQEKPLAGLMAFAQGETAWYLYGASNNQERNRMPTYLLQWEAMRWAKTKGCKQYDLWGVPDYPEEKLEEQFVERSEGLWGVYRFKRGFGGEVRRTIGTWDRVYRPGIYKLYQLWARYRPTSAA